MRRHAFVAAISLAALAACAPQIPEPPDTGPVRRNVSIEIVQPRPVSITQRLPVTLKPREEIELRAAVQGVILSLPHEEGDVIDASALPSVAPWIEAETYLADNPGADESALLKRNLAYLDEAKPFALIDDRAARIGFREAQLQYDAATRNMMRVLAYKDSTEAQLDVARVQRLAARAACDRLRQTIHEANVLSPRKGILKQRLRREGEYVNSGELIAIISVLDPLVAEFHVPETHKNSVQVGAEVAIEIRSVTDPETGRPASVTGKIRLVDAVAHPVTHTFRVEADVLNPGHKLPAGVFGTTNIVTYHNEAAITVPLTALRLQGDSVSLYTLRDGGTVKEHAGIHLGRMTSQWAEVLGGALRPGDRVIATGAALLADGDAVIVRADPLVQEATGPKAGAQ